jgi:dTDP-D-glucose 4,6-dehydratase
LENGKIGEIYNIGSDDHHEYTVSQVAHILIEKIIGTKDYDKWISYIQDRPFNDKRYYISNQKVKDLGWTIETEFNNGIDELIEKIKKIDY